MAGDEEIRAECLLQEADLPREVLKQAADFHDVDFEDDVQLQSAIKAGCSHLFTRDPTHFHTKALAVVPPSAFIALGVTS